MQIIVILRTTLHSWFEHQFSFWAWHYSWVHVLFPSFYFSTLHIFYTLLCFSFTLLRHSKINRATHTWALQWRRMSALVIKMCYRWWAAKVLVVDLEGGSSKAGGLYISWSWRPRCHRGAVIMLEEEEYWLDVKNRDSRWWKENTWMRCHPCRNKC